MEGHKTAGKSSLLGFLRRGFSKSKPDIFRSHVPQQVSQRQCNVTVEETGASLHESRGINIDLPQRHSRKRWSFSKRSKSQNSLRSEVNSLNCASSNVELCVGESQKTGRYRRDSADKVELCVGESQKTGRYRRDSADKQFTTSGSYISRWNTPHSNETAGVHVRSVSGEDGLLDYRANQHRSHPRIVHNDETKSVPSNARINLPVLIGSPGSDTMTSHEPPPRGNRLNDTNHSTSMPVSAGKSDNNWESSDSTEVTMVGCPEVGGGRDSICGANLANGGSLPPKDHGSNDNRLDLLSQRVTSINGELLHTPASPFYYTHSKRQARIDEAAPLKADRTTSTPSPNTEASGATPIKHGEDKIASVGECFMGSSGPEWRLDGMVTSALPITPYKVKTSTVQHLASLGEEVKDLLCNSLESLDTLVQDDDTQSVEARTQLVQGGGMDSRPDLRSPEWPRRQRSVALTPTDTSRDSGFDQLARASPIVITPTSTEASPLSSESLAASEYSGTASDGRRHSRPGLFLCSLTSLRSSEDSSSSSSQSDDTVSEKVVVRKSRSYHDLRRHRSLKSSQKTRHRLSLPATPEHEWSDSTFSESFGDQSGSSRNRGSSNSVVSPDSRVSGGRGMGHGVKCRRSWSKVDALSPWPEIEVNVDLDERRSSAESALKLRGRGKLKKSLKRRSVAVMDNVDRNMALTSTPKDKVMGNSNAPPWVSLVDIPGPSKKPVSMAASAVYIPGVSLADQLRLAASKGHVDKIRELVAAGATFEPDREGRTALHYASLNGNADAVRTLILKGLDIDAQDTSGYTALHRAAAQGHLEVIRVLVLEGCLIDRQDDVHGNAALHEAAWNGYSKTLEVLIRNKANIHIINKAGFSALHLAAQNGHNQSARVLLYAACNPNLKNNYGDTAIHTAARYGHAGVTRILISARCDVNVANKNGDTALHISAALKRRKLAKLLVESSIKINVKNKQNETAVDVARRKDYPEIVFIITSQPKNPKKEKPGKKGEKEKKSGKAGEDKKEKKGFFFSWKNKSKDKDKGDVKEVKAAQVVTDPILTVPHAAHKHAPSLPSVISSSDFNSHMSPEDLTKGLRDRKQPPTAGQGHGTEGHGSHNSRGTSTVAESISGRGRKDKKSIKGLHTEYDYKTGTQYYKDLAGNIREGPIGFTPVCKCGPTFKKLEKRMESDRSNLYDHIDASHRTLSQRIDHLDGRTAQQVFSIDKLMQERLDAEKRERAQLIRHKCADDQREVLQQTEEHNSKLKSEMKVWMNSRFSMLEQRYDNHAGRCDGCHAENCTNDHSNQYPRQQQQPHYHRDDLLNNQFCYTTEEPPPPPGKLYRSKSDDTLSHASSHHSRRHWKMKGVAPSIRESEASRYTRADRESHRERRQKHRAKKEREAAQRQQRGVSLDRGQRPPSVHNELRSGGGHEDPSEYREISMSPHRTGYGSLPRRKLSDNTEQQRHLMDSRSMRKSHELLDKAAFSNNNQMQVLAQVHHHRVPPPPSSTPNSSHPSHAIPPTSKSMTGISNYRDAPLPPPRTISHVTALNAHVTSEISVKPPATTQLHDTSASTFNSPDSAATQHSKTDSGSNPDSGYGSRIYNQNSKASLLPAEQSACSVSFQTMSGTDPGNSSQSTLHSPAKSPLYLTDTSRYQAPHNTPQAKSPTAVYASGVVNRWYEQKLREKSVERTLDDSKTANSVSSTPVYHTYQSHQAGHGPPANVSRSSGQSVPQANRTGQHQAPHGTYPTSPAYTSPAEIGKATEV